MKPTAVIQVQITSKNDGNAQTCIGSQASWLTYKQTVRDVSNTVKEVVSTQSGNFTVNFTPISQVDFKKIKRAKLKNRFAQRRLLCEEELKTKTL